MNILENEILSDLSKFNELLNEMKAYLIKNVQHFIPPLKTNTHKAMKEYTDINTWSKMHYSKL